MPQQSALQHYIETGGGYVEFMLPRIPCKLAMVWWFGRAYFVSHPAIQQATVKVADRVIPESDAPQTVGPDRRMV